MDKLQQLTEFAGNLGPQLQLQLEWVRDVQQAAVSHAKEEIQTRILGASPLALGLGALGVSVGIALPAWWYIRSYGSYFPNNGLKFDLPPKDLYPFKHRWMTLDINYQTDKITVEPIDDPTKTDLPCIHYIDENSDDDNDREQKLCFIMFHGNPTWSFLYRKIVSKLSPKYRCICIDCPGFGLSTAPSNYTFTTLEHSEVLHSVIKKIDNQRKIGNIISIHQDWGGPTGFDVILKLQQQNGKNIIGMVIGNTFAWNINKLDRFDMYMFSKIIGGFIGRIFNYGLNLTVPFFFNTGFEKKNEMSDDEWYYYKKPFENAKSRKGVTKWADQIFKTPKVLTRIEGNLPKVFKSVKVLFCWGMKDFGLDARMLHRFEQTFPNHKTVEFENANHFWQQDVGDEASEHILTWTSTEFNT